MYEKTEDALNDANRGDMCRKIEDSFIKIPLDVRAAFAQYCEMVEVEYTRACEAGVFDVPRLPNMPMPNSLKDANALNPEELKAIKADYEVAKVAWDIKQRACQEHWLLRIAHSRIAQVKRFKDDDGYSTGRGTEWLDTLMVADMLALSPVTQFDILTKKTRKKYAKLLINLRLEGLIKRSLLVKYGLVDHFIRAITLSID